MSAGGKEKYREARTLFDQRRFAEALTAYEQLASAGDPRCQLFVGWMVHEGLGTAPDPERALHWFRMAASLGSKEAAFYCGKCFLAVGRRGEAIDWFQRAAEKDYGPALLWLGLLKLRGVGEEADLDRGVKYLQRASATGNFPARRELALLMMRGKLGLAKIPLGFALFVYAISAAIVSGISQGHSDKLMG